MSVRLLVLFRIGLNAGGRPADGRESIPIAGIRAECRGVMYPPERSEAGAFREGPEDRKKRY